MILNTVVEIPDDFSLPTKPSSGRGKHCFLYQCPETLKEELGLEGKEIALKVFDEIKNNKPYGQMKWGDDPTDPTGRRNTLFKDATIIQNICAWLGLAPRVYAIVRARWKGEEYVAQVTDWIPDVFNSYEEAYALYLKVVKMGNEYGWEVAKQDVSQWDVRGGKLVDFQTFKLNDKYREVLHYKYKEGTKWGKIYYQENEAMGLSGGPRNFEQRVREMGLEEIDFEGKTVLDIGCSGGNFVTYALDRGAKKAVGIDLSYVAKGARWAANNSGHYRADFYGVDIINQDTEGLSKILGEEKFDIVFYLSMLRHTHFPSFVWKMCRETAIIEWNNWRPECVTRAIVDEKFKVIKSLRTMDHGDGKPVWICKPK